MSTVTLSVANAKRWWDEEVAREDCLDRALAAHRDNPGWSVQLDDTIGDSVRNVGGLVRWWYRPPQHPKAPARP